MTVNAALRAVAGAFVVASVALGVWVNPWFFAFTAFVGLNLFQSAFSGYCPMMTILRKAGCRDDEERHVARSGSGSPIESTGGRR
jgi:hypothetical protein